MYEKKLIHNVETGEITYENMTPEEIEQRDRERADSEARYADAPKSEVDELRQMLADLSRQVAELQSKVE